MFTKKTKYFLIFLILLSISIPVFAEEATQETQEEVKPMTKEDMLGRLNTIFEFRMDIREAFPVERLGENKFAYNGTPLENMDEDSLLILLSPKYDLQSKLRIL